MTIDRKALKKLDFADLNRRAKEMNKRGELGPEDREWMTARLAHMGRKEGRVPAGLVEMTMKNIRWENRERRRLAKKRPRRRK
jgi:hypothetical protein